MVKFDHKDGLGERLVRCWAIVGGISHDLREVLLLVKYGSFCEGAHCCGVRPASPLPLPPLPLVSGGRPLRGRARVRTPGDPPALSIRRYSHEDRAAPVSPLRHRQVGVGDCEGGQGVTHLPRGDCPDGGAADGGGGQGCARGLQEPRRGLARSAGCGKRRACLPLFLPLGVEPSGITSRPDAFSGCCYFSGCLII